ncbi:MAG: protein kinase, partial [Planctomycetes bacterium]|nr:protein kinase [Planctomycetota bacterium]
MSVNNPNHVPGEGEASVSLSRCLEDMGLGLGRKPERAASRSARSSVTPPSADGMEQALESSINQTLGKADGGFLAGLLDSGQADDPAFRDYGDRYQYLDVLGEGGQGKVLRFRDTVLDRDVAIKVVKPPYTTDRERLLENEARLGGMLEHPNILPTYDLCRDETGSPFFVMKKVEGVSLDELLKKAHAEGGAIHSNRDRGEFSRRRLLNIFLQVCHAMQYAHSRGVCHLDLKPQNIKLGPFGEVYVLDWGFAARTEDNPKMVAGTPLYIAPERFRPGKPDARCDIYSLGVMLYRILVNHLPRDVGKTSFREFRRRLADFPIIPPRQRDPSLPRDLEAITLKAMSEDPDERYQTVAELAGDLERFLDILPVTAYREGISGRALKFARRHRATVLAGTVMLVAALLTLLASLRARHSEAAALRAKAMEDAAWEEMKETERRLQALREELDREEELLKKRAKARMPLEKGLGIMDRSKAAVDKEPDNVRKLQLLQPAIDLFTQSLVELEGDGEESPYAAEAYFARARAFEQAREIGPAIEDYRNAYTRDRSYIMARYYLGMIYFDIMNDAQKALEEFAAMNVIDEGNEFSEVGRAYIEAHTGQEAEALARVDRIEERERLARGDGVVDDSWRNPGLYHIWGIRGKIYGNERGRFFDPEKAIEAYSHYLLYDPDKPSPYLNRGRLHESLRSRALRAGDRERAARELDDAIADYSRALAIDPGYKYALQHRGYALFKYKNQVEEGLRDIEAALAVDPQYTAALLDRAAIRESQGAYDLAEKDYLVVREISPAHPNIDYRLAILYLYTNDLAKAEPEMDRAIDKAPGSQSRGIRHHRRGMIRFLRGNFTGAVEDFDRSLELRNTDKIYPALMRWLALTKMGQQPTPEDLARNIDVGSGKPWLAVVASIYLGDDPFGEDQALRLADTPEAVCETGFYLGARAWARGETVNALSYLTRSVDSGVHLYMEYIMAKILAGRLTSQRDDYQMLPDTLGPS